MNSKDLVLAAINHQKVNRLPKGELCIEDEIVKNTLDCKEVGFDEKLEFINWLGLDIVCLQPEYPRGEELTIDISKLDLNKWRNTDLFKFVVLNGPFELGLSHFGFRDFMSMIMVSKDEVLRFVEKVEEVNSMVINELADSGVDGVIIADDVAFDRGLMIKPKVFRDVFIPSLEKQVREINRNKLIPFFHSDGYYLEILPDIQRAGFRGINCIDKNCHMNLQVLDQYKDNLCLWGHLDVFDIDDSIKRQSMEDIVDYIRMHTNFKGIIIGTNSGLFSGLNVMQLRKIYQNIDRCNAIT